MRLVELLGTLDDETLERLSHEHLGPSDTADRATICLNLEGELKSPKHVREAVFNLQPPSFSIFEALLETPEHRVSLAGLRERVTGATRKLSEAVSAGELAGRRDLDVYRRVLVEARRSDLTLDPSELALLHVLRRELAIRTVEHFLAEHHAEMRHFWDTDSAFLDAINGLRSGGLAFHWEGHLVFPDDLIPFLKQTIGVEAGEAARRRLFERVAGAVLSLVAQDLHIKASGSKDEKVQRLLENFVQPSEVLDQLGLGELRQLCKDVDVPSGGNKEDVVARLVDAFATDKDIRPPETATLPPPAEPRCMAKANFEALLNSLRQSDLSDMLAGIGSRRVTGSKEMLLALVLDSSSSEVTLLQMLTSRQLEYALDRNSLSVSGTKPVRIGRLIDHFTQR